MLHPVQQYPICFLVRRSLVLVKVDSRVLCSVEMMNSLERRCSAAPLIMSITSHANNVFDVLHQEDVKLNDVT